jgi:hypothetical protein
MRALEFNLQPQQVKISAEEILADLNYPAPVAEWRNGAGSGASRRPRRR